MFTEIGHFALILALCVAVVQGTLPLIGAQRNNATWMALASPAALAQLLLIAISFAALTHAFVTSDFSVLNVAKNSHSDKPMLYKVSGVWGNHEGSMLLWVFILAIYGGAVAAFGRNLPPGLKARALAIQAMVSVGFLAFILFTSNPFERLVPPPFDGQGLNPLLQDPGLAFHPPFLYLGYVGFSMAFSFAIAALIEGRVDAAWARWVRPWTLVAWITLTIGIGLGSWWAYYELGWGGWWFWDPVENASFMPWLAGTALLHSSMVVEKRDGLKAWTIFLAIITFGLSLLGTFLVRSGVLSSVHAFASDPERGVFILGLLLITVAGSLTLFAWRGPSMKAGGLFQPISREGSLLLNNLLMSVAAGAVLLGTLFPLMAQVFDYKVSVGAPFFNAVFIPLMVPMVVAMGIGPLLSWKRGDLMPAMRRLWVALAVTIIVAGITGVMVGDDTVMSMLGLGMATWLAVGTLVEFSNRTGLRVKKMIHMPRSAWGMTVTHFGLAITIAGMTGAGLWKVESIQAMQPGDKALVGGYEFTLEGARTVPGPNYTATQGTFTVRKDGETVVVLYPEKRVYPVQGRPTSEADIHTMFMGDLYAVIGDPQGAGYVTRLYWNPLVPWMWVGGLVMVLGGILSLTDRRFRIGAPTRSRVRAAAAAE
ncbi:heme lyase CcmF/NrfE family subunit [Magnetospira sp. QH-2]|uniref:heme lyase CcmF/NrfE family subunit n=1 Tax=Magnetospira sp. (strain QH-2) TaxID=1288970 RepID=UPI0003E80B2B|nr:heme lyase CcmF/NrfE family subunit [Magnetospira sp. QH-2]CCQ75361.1 Cytochrome c-type biogenesis protein CycK [Magnetospira sp. QH-2]